MAVITDNSGVEVKIDLLNSFSGNNNVMTNHTQFDPASRTGTADAKPELDLDVENQDEAEDNGDDAALSLRRNRLLKKGLAASCGAAVVAAAFVIGAEWTASTMVSKSSVIEPASQVVNKNKSYSPKSSKSKSCKAAKGEPNGSCRFGTKVVCILTKVYVLLTGKCGSACCLVNYCNGNCGKEFPTCGKAFTTTTRYLEAEETMTAVAAEEDVDLDLDALLAEFEIDDTEVKEAIIDLIESTDFSNITEEEFITSLLSKVDTSAFEEEEEVAMFLDPENVSDSDRPSSWKVCFKPF